MIRIAAALFLVSLASSTTVRAQEEPELPRGLYPVLHDEGLPPQIVLRARTDARWARGPVRLVHRDTPTLMVRRVALGALPAEVRADARGTLELSDGRQIVCTARIGRPRILRHVWAEPDDMGWSDGNGTPQLTDEELTREAWEMDAEGELLVAEVVRLDGDCSRATWASRNIPAFGVRSSAPSSELLEAFRALPDHREFGDEWRRAREHDDDPIAPHWDTAPEAGLTVIELRVGSRHFSLIYASAHGDCSDFIGTLWALFERRDDTINLVRCERWRDHVPPSGLADFDRDGVPEVLSFERVSYYGGVADVTAMYVGCSC